MLVNDAATTEEKGAGAPHEASLPAAAAALGEQLRAHDPAASAASTLPDDSVGLLKSAGMFRLGLPSALGGFEADPVTLIRVAESLAYADGSAAWVTMTANSSMFMAWLDQDVAAHLLNGQPGQPISSSFSPAGLGVEVDGGYRVSGRWSYVSNVSHAAMAVASFIVADPDGSPRSANGRPVMRWGVIPAAYLRILPTWDGAAGMRGTGSHDMLVKNVFIRAEHTLMPPFELPQAKGALYRMPFFAIIRCLLVGIPLGVARRALDELTELIKHKTRDMVPLSQDQDTQIRLAKAEAALRASRSFALETTERLWATVQSGDDPSVSLRADHVLAAQLAMRDAVEAVNLAFGIAGVSAALAGNVIQRCWLDVNVASQHVAFSQARWRGAGQALLGLDTDPVFL
jgi:indole-3-acetate monooxygenase